MTDDARRPMMPRYRPTWLLVGVAALVMLAVGAAFIRLVERYHAATSRKATSNLATTLVHRVEMRLVRSLSALDALAVSVRQGGNAQSIDAVATAIVGAGGGIGALAIAPNGVVAQVYPPGAADPLLGRKLLADPATQPAAAEAVQARQPVLASTRLTLREPRVILGYQPVFVPGPSGRERLWGLVVLRLSLDELMPPEDVETLVERGYHYQLSTTTPASQRRITVARSTELDLPDPVHAAVIVRGVEWALSVAPVAGWRSGPRLATEIVLVLVATVLIAGSTHRLLREPERLRREVEVRRRRLSDARRELQAEVDQRRQAEERLLHDAAHDSVTGLPNRDSLTSQVQAALDFIGTRNGMAVAALFLDLDRFKHVNDGLGPAVADELLVQVGRRLREGLRPDDGLARIGGDEFAVLLCDVPDAEGATAVARRLLEVLKPPFSPGGHEVFVTASIGVVVSGASHREAGELLRDAETAMRRAKALGRARLEVFQDSMRTRVTGRLQLENDLRRAIEHEELVVYFQPIVSLDTGTIAGCEALVRWRHPGRGLLPPMEFIPLAEETGLITWIDRWVLGAACRQVRDWQLRLGLPLTVSANLSGRQMAEPGVAEHVARTLHDAGVDPSSLKIEITESVVMENVEVALEILGRLQTMGVRLLLDDFGTGYSSLSYLDRFPFHGVKIDQSFVKRMHANARDEEIVRTVVNLADKLGMETIAEGIETTNQLGRLRELGCRYGQGYLFAKPLEATALEALLESRPRW